MAKPLTAGMTESRKPDDYTDEHRDALQEMIEHGPGGEPAPANRSPPKNVIDLVSVLQQSIEKTKGKPAAKSKPSKLKKPTSRKPRKAACRMSPTEYTRKRDFAKTAESPASKPKKSRRRLTDLPQPRVSRWGQAITAAEMKRCHWGRAHARLPGALCGMDPPPSPPPAGLSRTARGQIHPRSRARKSRRPMKTRATLSVAGTPLDVTNLDKILYPKSGFTKGQVIDYHMRISPVLLPYLQTRPLTLERYPDGVESFFFYEKKYPSPWPEWIKNDEVAEGRRRRDRLLCDGRPSRTRLGGETVKPAGLHRREDPRSDRKIRRPFSRRCYPRATAAVPCRAGGHLRNRSGIALIAGGRTPIYRGLFDLRPS